MSAQLVLTIRRMGRLYFWHVADTSGAYVASGPMTPDKDAAARAGQVYREALAGQASLLAELAPSAPPIEQRRMF